MELVLGILEGLAIFVVAPVFVGAVVAGGFIVWDRRARKDHSIEQLACSIDADCPAGFVCKNGVCIPATP